MSLSKFANLVKRWCQIQTKDLTEIARSIGFGFTLIQKLEVNRASPPAGERLAFTAFRGRRYPGSIPLFGLRSKD